MAVNSCFRSASLRSRASSPFHLAAQSVLVVVITLGFARQLHAGVIDGPVVNPANGHAYYLLDADTWTSSESQAEALGGHLATVNDAAENTWLFSTFEKFGGVDRYLWIGLQDPTNDFLTGSAHQMLFGWADGDTSTYRNWGPAQPDNNGAREFYGMIWRAGDPQPNQVPGTWNDAPNSLAIFIGSPPAYGVVEVATPLPASAWGVVLGAVTAALLGRRTLLRPAH